MRVSDGYGLLDVGETCYGLTLGRGKEALPERILNELSVRRLLLSQAEFSDPDSVVYPEMPLQRRVGRADVGLVNGSLSGYEIKSERDTLSRLPRQIPIYESIFDYTTLVVAAKHLKRSRTLLPPKWGLAVVDKSEDVNILRRVRKPKRNRQFSNADRVRLLWKVEIARLLREAGTPVRPDVSVRVLWGMMSEWSSESIADAVRSCLKARLKQGVATPPVQDGG